LCRGSRDLSVFKATGSPAQAFGDDDYGICYFHVTANKLHAHGLLYQAYEKFFNKLTGQQ